MGSCFFLLVALCLTAQEIPGITHHTSDDYHAGSQNWMISQDCAGKIYVANASAVLIYNGFRWQRVATPSNRMPRTVFKGKDCRIYVGGYEFFGYIDNTSRSEPYYVPLADTLLRHTRQEIWNIIGQGDTLLFQSFSNLFVYDYSQIKEISLPSNIMLGQVAQDRYYIPKVRQGLYVYEDGMRPISVVDQLSPDTKITAVVAAPVQTGTVIGTQDNGLYFLGRQHLTPLASPLNEVLKKEQINKIIRLSDGSYAIGTILNGVYITEDFVTTKYHINKLNGLSNNTVLALFEDRNRNLWVGLDRGLDMIELSNPINFYYDIEGKLGTVFASIQHQGTLYLGTNLGLFRETRQGEYAMINASKGQVWSLIEVDNDLLCGHNTGTFMLRDDRLELVSEVAGGWAMEALNPRRVLQASYNGLILLKKSSGNWTFDTYVENGDLLIMKFVLNGRILTGYHASYGICILYFSEDFSRILERKTFHQLEGIDLTPDPGLFKDKDRAIITLGDDILIAQDMTLRKMTEAEWTDTLDPRLAQIKAQYTITKEITDRTFWTNTPNYSTQLLDSIYIVGAEEGYMRIPAYTNWQEKERSFPTVDYLEINDEYSVIPEELNLLPHENDLLIVLTMTGDYRYTASSYHYQLRGWGDTWHPLPKNGRLDFNNLDDGQYELFLKNSRSTQSLLRFKIEPYWYESWKGGIFYLSLFSLFLLGLDRWHRRKLRQQEEQLKTAQAKELESRMIKAKNESLQHELLYKSKMLANSTMTVIQKNKMLSQLKDFINKEITKGEIASHKKQKIFNLIDRNINSDQDWEIFERNFATVHRDFLTTLKKKYPDLTTGELRLAAYIRLDLSSKEIAPLLNIGVRSVENKRYRLRKRMDISNEETLKSHLMKF